MVLIPPPIQFILARLEKSGHPAWCVGGCVRDSLLGRAPADWDITTSALPSQTAACFSGETLIETGRKHGTIALVTEMGPVEITTHRIDGTYSDHRRPEQVAFTQNLEQDLARRDFTVNAMAYHPQRGLADPFGGEKDLRQGLLRCVGDPARRFDEDALRILRCLRFGAALGFAIEEATARAAMNARDLLPKISGERLREELTKLLCAPWMLPVLEQYSPILFAALPELAPLSGCAQNSPYHRFDCWGHTLHAVNAAPPQPALRWAALLHDCGKPAVKSTGPDGLSHFYGHTSESAALCRQILTRLRFSNQEIESISTLVARHGEPLPMSEKRVKRLLGALGEKGFAHLLDLIAADVSAQAEEIVPQRLAMVEQAWALSREILRRGDCLTLSGLAVRGNDLMKLGYSPGPELGQALNTLLEEVLEGRLKNERPALLARAEELSGPTCSM